MKRSLETLAALAMSGLAQSAAGTAREMSGFSRALSVGPTRRRHRHWFDDGTPRGVPGAKLARKASKGRLGMATLR